MKEDTNRDLLYTLLVECPNPYELKKICRDLNAKYNELVGENTAEKGDSLFIMMQYENRLPELETVLRKHYPNRFDILQRVPPPSPPSPPILNRLALFISDVLKSGFILLRFSPRLRKLVNQPISYIALVFVLFVIIIVPHLLSLLPSHVPNPPYDNQASIGFKELLPDPNDHTGICVTIDCAFYFGGVNAVYKLDAVAAANHNDQTDALTYLQWASDTDITDAEAKILLTNKTILNTKTPYIIAAVATTLTCIDTQPTPEDRLEINAGRDTLQGAYIAQQIYNKAHPDRPLLLEIVNLGTANISQESDANKTQENRSQQLLAHSLIEEAQQYSVSFLGVIGLPFGPFDTFVGILSTAHIPMLSLAPQTNNGAMPYFASIVPSLTEVAHDIASYIKSISHTVYLVSNSDTYYSSQMSTALSIAVGADGFTAYTSTYSETNLQSDLTSAAHQINTEETTANSNDPVLFIGSPEDAAQFYSQLQNKTIPMFGDDSLFDYVNLPEPMKKQLNGVTFFAFAFEDQWLHEKENSLEPVINGIYAKEYNSGNKRRGSYSFERTSDTVLLAYDALSLLASAGNEANPLPGCQTSKSSCTFTSQKCLLPPPAAKSLREQQWTFIHACAFVGASGEINLSWSASNPVNKELLVLQIVWDQKDYGEVTHTISKFGQFVY